MERMENERPDMYRIYRDERAARIRCREDIVFHIQHLAAAVLLGDHEVFVAYKGWLEEMLTARAIPTDDVARSFVALRDEVRERYGENGEPAVAVIEAVL
jgi:hypothetical protein